MRPGWRGERKNFSLAALATVPPGGSAALVAVPPSRQRRPTAVPPDSSAPSQLRSRGSLWQWCSPPDGSALLTAVLSLAAAPPYSSAPLAAALPPAGGCVPSRLRSLDSSASLATASPAAALPYQRRCIPLGQLYLLTTALSLDGCAPPMTAPSLTAALSRQLRLLGQSGAEKAGQKYGPTPKKHFPAPGHGEALRAADKAAP